ncbi:MAG: DUF4239 domain-containing protein [Verrucomicrobia bacterium]|nr:DUF4239 domain-containing protein [Verrucomicrobiota bacterium]
MDDWFHSLSFWWMALVVGAMVYLGAGVIFVVVSGLGRGTRAQVFKNVSIGLLSPLGTIFGLLVVFILAQVWSDMDRAELAVDREASALRSVLLLATAFPGEPEAQIRSLVRRHIDEAVQVEWPAMEKQALSLKIASGPLAEALRFVISLTPKTDGQITAQREMVTGVENALEARRHRIILSGWSVNPIKWICLIAQSVCVFVVIAMAHNDNRATAALAIGVFAAGVVVSVLLIVSHDKPFHGPVSVKPDLLLQVRPD